MKCKHFAVGRSKNSGNFINSHIHTNNIQKLSVQDTNRYTAHIQMEQSVLSLTESHPKSVVIITTDEIGSTHIPSVQDNWYGGAVLGPNLDERPSIADSEQYLQAITEDHVRFERSMDDFGSFLVEIIERHFADTCYLG
jgi:hypothetical protein